LTPGYKDSSACAKMCADECQNAFFPSLSFQVNSTNDPDAVSGVLLSMI